MAGDDVSEYHVQAAIAATHARACDPQSIDWPMILELYDQLLAMNPSPVVALNRAVAVAKVHGAGGGAGGDRARSRTIRSCATITCCSRCAAICCWNWGGPRKRPTDFRAALELPLLGAGAPLSAPQVAELRDAIRILTRVYNGTEVPTQMNYYQENQAAFLEGLKTFLRIPSISTLSEHKPDIRRAAEFALGELRAAGLTGELIEGEGNPLVYAEWLGAPGKPTLLLYGHYDVQPPDPLDEWKSPPFEPEVRGDDIFGRGTVRRQGPDLHPDQSRGRLAEDPRQAAGQREIPDRGRRRNRRRAHRELRGEKARAPRIRRRGDLRYRNVRAGAAHHLRGSARHRVRRIARGRRESRSAFGRIWRRGAQSACRRSPKSSLR